MAEANGEDGAQRRVARDTLLNLRLASKEFANMGIINGLLFREIQLQATEDNLTRTQQTNMITATFVPFVPGVRFRHTYHSGTLSYSDCAKVVPNVADVFHKNHIMSSYDKDYKHVQDYVNTHWHGEIPTSKGSKEMRDAQQGYLSLAGVDDELMSDGTFKEVWLKFFCRATKIDFS